MNVDDGGLKDKDSFNYPFLFLKVEFVKGRLNIYSVNFFTLYTTLAPSV